MKAKQVFEFVRNQNPIKSLGLGYEGKIRSFFKPLGISDDEYEIKENEKILLKYTLDLHSTDITEIPDNLTIGGGLDLRNTQIIKLPDNLVVQFSIHVDRDQTKLIDFINNSKFKNQVKIY
jgi:hypothetical protein